MADNTLSNDQVLMAGQQIVSQNGRYRLIMQNDGNLAGYGPGYPFWDTGTWNVPLRPDRAVMQSDGNLVLYAGPIAVWATGTDGNDGAELILQDDRNLVIYRQDGTAIWASGTEYVPAAELHVSTNREVGSGKRMRIDGRLYRSGHFAAEVYTKNDNFFGGLRGKALAFVVDEGGHAIWVSEQYSAPTRCSVPDPSCASYGQSTWTEKFPEPVGRFAARVDLYVADTASFVDLRNKLIEFIKAGRDVAVEVKAVWDELAPS